MRTRLMVAIAAAAILSTATAMPDENSQFQSGTHRANTAAVSQEQAVPVAIKATSISLEPDMSVRRRAAIAALLLIGATAPCVHVDGRMFVASGGC